jgi:hypothetical protein
MESIRDTNTVFMQLCLKKRKKHILLFSVVTGEKLLWDRALHRIIIGAFHVAGSAWSSRKAAAAQNPEI